MGIFKPNKYVFFVFFALIWGIPMMLFSLGTINDRLSIDIQGLVVSREVVKYRADPAGYYSIYQIRQDDGTIIEYTAHRNDPSLSVDMPDGATLIKRKWELSYTVKGKVVNDFPTVFYPVNAVIGLSILVTGLFFGIRGLTRRKTN